MAIKYLWIFIFDIYWIWIWIIFGPDTFSSNRNSSSQSSQLLIDKYFIKPFQVLSIAKTIMPKKGLDVIFKFDFGCRQGQQHSGSNSNLYTWFGWQCTSYSKQTNNKKNPERVTQLDWAKGFCCCGCCTRNAQFIVLLPVGIQNKTKHEANNKHKYSLRAIGLCRDRHTHTHTNSCLLVCVCFVCWVDASFRLEWHLMMKILLLSLLPLC